MKTINTSYISRLDLEIFIDENIKNKEDNFLVQVFCGIPNKKYIQQIISQIKHFLPNCSIIGSTTDGEITNGKVSTLQTTISITKFDKAKFHVDFVEYNDDIKQSAKELYKKIANDDTKLIITFTDGLNTNGEEFLKSIIEENNDITISGGLAGDNGKFDKTYVFTHEEVLSNGAVGVSIEGDINLYTDYSFHWEPIGKEMTITKAKDNILYTIDDKSAFETYKYYLGEEVANRLPAIGIEFPLIMKKNGTKVARAIVGMNEDKSLVFAGNLNVGDKIQFGYGNSELILNQSNQIAINLSNHPIESLFVYSCMARRRFMPNQIEHELAPLNLFTDISGFFTYGEFYSSHKDTKELLNQTMTILALSETTQKNQVDFTGIIDDKVEDTIAVKALSHLVNITSKELNLINNDLQVSIQREKEVTKKQKDLIFAQAKMAQMGDMIGNIAHQWRQPLSNIITATSSMKIQKDLGVLKDDFFNNVVDTVTNNVHFLSDTITTFRNFLKEDKEFKEHILQDTLHLVLEIVTPSLNDYHIALHQDIEEEKNLKVIMVADELSQVLINIINNAKDAIIENGIKNGYIKIKSYEKNKTIYIVISDNAGGIPQEVLPKIFDPYFTTKGLERGTGIGLNMSKDIIEKHMEGKIYAKNSKEGAIFTIELPCCTKIKSKKL